MIVKTQRHPSPDWHKTTISQSSYLKGRIGWQGLRASEFLEEGPYLITGTDFKSGEIDWNSCYRVTEERYQEAKYIHVRDNDVLITKDGTIGKIAFVRDCPKKAVLNSGIFLLRCSDGSYEHEFIYHLLNSYVFSKFLDDNLAGSTIQHLYQNIFERFEFPIPNKDEQTQIVRVLSTVDRAIAQTEALIAKQQRIKTGLMQDLLTKGIDENGNIRSEATHRFKDSPLGRIPAEWEVSNIEQTGSWFSGGTPPKANSRFWNGGVPWICPKDMKTFELSSSIDTISEYAIANGTRIMPEGTVYIVVRGMILAHTFPVAYGICAAAFNQDVKAVITNIRLNSRYLAYWFVSNTHEFLALTTTATHGTKRFDIKELFAVPIGIPSINEQNNIVKIFDEQQTQVDQLVDSACKLRSLKDGLMQDLLTGRVRVESLFLDNYEHI